MNSKNIKNNVGIFNDSASINNVCKEYHWDEQKFIRIVLGVPLHPNSQVQLECVNITKNILVLFEGLHNIIDMFQCHGTNLHGWVMFG